MKLELHHINISGADTEALDRFWGDVLMQQEIPEMATLPTLDDDAVSVPVTFRGNDGTQFHLAGMDHQLGLRHGKAINPLAGGHIAFRTDDIEAFKAHLEARDVPYVDYGTTFTKAWHQIFFLDPVGTIIEVHQVL